MLNFLCIGAQKSATTWLYETLSKHPGINFPGGKEVHFWNGRRSDDVDWYKSVFSNNRYLNGDITPAYGILSKDVIQKIYSTFPHLRLVYLIRNPMDRAWSSARMALSRAEMASDEGSDQWFIDHFMSRGSLARGDYESCIRQWRSVFPSEQLLIVEYEDIKNNPVLTSNKILNHLGLDSFYEESQNERLSKKVFQSDGVEMRQSLIPVLHDIYKDKIDSLGEYLDKDFSHWKKI